MHWGKRFLATAAVIAVVLLLIFAGTLGIRSREENGESTGFDKKETIYFWYSDDALTNYINGAAVAFGEEKGVRVIPVLTSDSNYLEEINRASLHSQQMPDAYIIGNDSLEKAYLAGLACEIADEQNVCNTEHFPQTALSAVSYKDKLAAYPFYFDTSVLLYNKTYLQQWAEQQEEKESVVPVTVDDILNIANTFDAPETVEGVMKWDVSDIFYNYWIVGNYMIVGGDSGDDESNININNEQTKACLEVYKALNQFFFIESDTVSYDSVVQDFIDGKLVFTIGTVDVIKRLEEASAEKGLTYEYGYALMPEISEELESRSLSVTNVVAINGYSEHKELANQFASYLVDGYKESLYERTGKASANKNANQDNEALKVFFEEYADSVSLPKLMEIGNLWLQLEALFSQVWNGEEVPTLVQELADQIATQVVIQ